jgi:sulfur-oxidizing protein SoxY
MAGRQSGSVDGRRNSISEDPDIRFTYVPHGAKRFRVGAKDTDGHLFQNEWKVDGSGV